MKIYLIKRDDPPSWDDYVGFVVAAPNPTEARLLVLEEFHRAELIAFWSAVPVQHIGQAKPGTVAGVILSDFNAG